MECGRKARLQREAKTIKAEKYETKKENDKSKKGEILQKIMSVVEILPVSECQRVCDYLLEFYFS